MDIGDDVGFLADFTFDFNESGSYAGLNSSEDSVRSPSDISVASIEHLPYRQYPLQCHAYHHFCNEFVKT